jgi:hypothetical protein
MSDLISVTSRGYFIKPDCYFTDLPDVIVDRIILPLIKARSLDEEDVVDDRLTENSRTKPHSE